MSKSSAIAITLTILQLSALFVTGAAVHLVTENTAPSVGYLAAAILLLVMARQMRALENIVHFASHNDISSNQRLNDLCVNILAGWPMLLAVQDYRSIHLRHHGHYGSHLDPCRARFQRMGRDGLDRKGTGWLVLAVLRSLPGYVVEYFCETPRRISSFVAAGLWHIMWLATVAVLWTSAAAIDMAIAWLLAMLVVLPPLRLVAELAEHDYDEAGPAATTTFNNLGVANVLLFHPAGDAYHALHHLYPSVPWWKQGAAHRYLSRHDQSYRMVRTRDRVLA